ncbi:hypothetical protein G647_10065 [Cladophialophora carrionii CBS 160.54]|uniref:DUF3328 domain-containing protein n=1 Tax=Cladophialophora carrionii CBS 160.54 TaxID=1279043 RepID=V9DJV6_9EURO|nr:uncharacterized protein G647_10065 [Cladophialophora carrionii CBS 160.54]ETI26966.1 hypothetical protein G647_10065 [Cladophialophora carrionii CBS 160.54]
MSSSLRFRPPAYLGEKDPIVPRTPKSPRGAYTGDPIPVRKQSHSHLRRAITLVFLFGTLAAAALLFLALVPHYHVSLGLRFPALSSLYRTADKGPGTRANQQSTPPPPTEIIQAVFADQHAFQMPGAKGDRAWLNMFPKGDGRVKVRDPEMRTQIYDVAVVKQLECLAFLRHILIDYSHEQHPQAHEISRAYHCLDHVRQAVLCAADTTLEPTTLQDGMAPRDQAQRYGHEATSGAHVNPRAATLHTCKNWTAVKRWIEENGCTNESGIDSDLT